MAGVVDEVTKPLSNFKTLWWHLTGGKRAPSRRSWEKQIYMEIQLPSRKDP